jgi:hypothetical protein
MLTVASLKKCPYYDNFINILEIQIPPYLPLLKGGITPL